jgi:diaminohydroxyphosphoribosylaminopyrimidine deaminase/5-amino-6-(5-phosphoribosylamino)uracil reductase
MSECFRLAEKGAGFVSPNPLVGAVLIKNKRIVARGYHHRFGEIHAEIDCLRRYRGNARGTVLYVNLEPCCHQGKTPPCVDAIIESGIRRVFVGMKDPNPRVSGRGIAKLRGAGIQVVVGILEREAAELNRRFARHITTGLPYVHLKVAQTLDGRIGWPGGPSRSISSPSSRRLVHTWRSIEDAVLVGAGTVRSDDPSLTVRMTRGRNPHVVVLDGKLTSSPTARVFRNQGGRLVFLCVDRRFAALRKGRYLAFLKKGIRILTFPGDNGVLNMADVLAELYHHNIGSLLVEGGSQVFGQLIDSGLVDELSIFVSPSVMGAGVPAFGGTAGKPRLRKRRSIDKMHIVRVGGDALLKAYFTS